MVACAYSFSAKNADGVTIYYNFIGDERLEVTSGPTKYSGDVVIPDEVNYLNMAMYKVTSIGERAFYECSDLKSVVIGNNVTWISHYAFTNCSNLTDLTLGNSLTNTGTYAFSGCVGLTSLTLPESMKAVGSGSFSGCTALTSIIIPDNVNTIQTSAFGGCSGVETITIGKTVTSIGGNAFACGDNVETVFSYIEEPFVISGKSSGSMTFKQSTFKNAILYVPDGTVDKYKATNGWKDFTKIKPISESYKYFLYYVVDGEIYKSYELKAGESIMPEPEPTKEGYSFSGWGEIPETMPAHDVTINGSFSINSYKLTYMVDDNVYKETMYEYGATIIPEPQPEGDYATFEWNDLPQTMPAHDVVVYASYTSGIIEVLMSSQRIIRIYSPNGKKQKKLQKGLNIEVLDDGTIKKVVVK